MTIPIRLDNASYDITIGPLVSLSMARKILIVTNPKVAGLHLQTLLGQLQTSETYVHTMPEGEEHKNLASLESILEACFIHKLDRKSCLIAFGGGVVGDITGFAAGIYQRGIDFIQIPTTLLSQVDASVGGKTGINNRFGKNLIGLFHQPKAVHIDTRFLDTLPPREFGAGVAEIVKMAVTFNRDFFTQLEANDLHQADFLQTAIAASVQTKAEVVSQDERESGIRAALNYGHTFGHVIENLTGYRRYLHGEAVAIGMVMANTLACDLGLLTPEESQRITALLTRYNLPTHYAIDDFEQFYELFFLDKKSQNATIKFILPDGIGSVVMKNDIPKTAVLQALTQHDREARQQ